MGERSPALDLLVLELTGKRVPKICFLPTASGDERAQVLRFHERFSQWPCEPTTLSLFRLGQDRLDPRTHLLTQDALYVGGGSMRNMLAIWREHRIDRIMRSAWNSGTVLAGLSAGAMCWFAGGISVSGGSPDAVAGIGLLADSLSVHRDGEPARLPVYREAVRRRVLPGGYAADDGAALVYGGRRMIECVASHGHAQVFHVAMQEGRLTERAMPVRHLPTGVEAQGIGAPRRHDEHLALTELRALRAGARRWD